MATTPYDQASIEPTLQKLEEFEDWATEQIKAIDEWTKKTGATTDNLQEALMTFHSFRAAVRVAQGVGLRTLMMEKDPQ